MHGGRRSAYLTIKANSLVLYGSDLTGLAWRISDGLRFDAEGKPCGLAFQL